MGYLTGEKRAHVVDDPNYAYMGCLEFHGDEMAPEIYGRRY